MVRGFTLAVVLIAVATAGQLFSQPAHAVDVFGKCDLADCAVVKEDRLQENNTNIVSSIMMVVLGALGSISILMIVIGGIRFVTSNGDPSAVSSAKKTVLYSVIGLVVAIMAAGIVFMVSDFFA